jgi:hypothetical protein
VSVEQGAFIGSVFLAVFSTALEARVLTDSLAKQRDQNVK